MCTASLVAVRTGLSSLITTASLPRIQLASSILAATGTPNPTTTTPAASFPLAATTLLMVGVYASDVVCVGRHVAINMDSVYRNLSLVCARI